MIRIFYDAFGCDFKCLQFAVTDNFVYSHHNMTFTFVDIKI